MGFTLNHCRSFLGFVSLSFPNGFLSSLLAIILSVLKILSFFPLVIHSLFFCLHILSGFLTLGEAFHFGPFSLVIADGTAVSLALCITVVSLFSLCSTDAGGLIHI